jgi:predicted cupin superfamily sugar epimerase
MTKGEVISILGLERHPLEGGYFRRTYESEASFGAGDGNRKLLSSIYYLLSSDSPIGFMHRNKSDIVHYYHLGEPASYMLISPGGEIFEKVLGPDISNGQHLQLVVPGGYWKASELKSGDYSLISEAVSPGFVYSDNQLATRELLDCECPEFSRKLDRYIAPADQP